MTTHKLDLLENAIDSLNEALAKFEEAEEEGNEKAYKFAVLHMSHFIELLLKHHVAQKHPLLIYTAPFAAKLDRNKTITLWDAVNFINNEAPDSVSDGFKKDLEWLKRLRNDIEHHKFFMDVAQTRNTLGRLFRSVLEFLESFSDIDLESHVSKETVETFKVLSDEYELRRRDAIKAADKIDDEQGPDPTSGDFTPARLDCPQCDNPTLVISAESSTGFRCLLCENENSGEIPSNCDICGAEETVGELVYWENEFGDREGRCYHCSGRYQLDKDD